MWSTCLKMGTNGPGWWITLTWGAILCSSSTFSRDNQEQTNQLGKFKRVQTCNSYVSPCAFGSVAMPKVMTRRKQQQKRYLVGEAQSPYSHTLTLKIAITEDDSQVEVTVVVCKVSASSTTASLSSSRRETVRWSPTQNCHPLTHKVRWRIQTVGDTY